MAFKLPDLPYSFNALEPHIDAKTMEIHHGKHHGTYVSKLNAAIEGTNFASKDIESLISKINALPENIRTAVRNNGGGHYNHSLFWNILSAKGDRQPSGELAEAINQAFGSFNGFKEKFEQAATNRFGSGWAWLGVQDNGQLCICSTPNQDTPIMDVAECRCRPILGLDVWEHAYYLKYQNRRPEYIAAFWNVLDWKAVSANYAKAKQKQAVVA